jgi:hypothetical protein
MQQHGAAWPKLPLRSLGFYEDSGPKDEWDGRCACKALPKECLAAVAQLTGLTHLTLEWCLGAKPEGLLPAVQQLTQLQQLSLWWEWITVYFDGFEQPLHYYLQRPEELQLAATDVHALMVSIQQCLPQLQQLRWLCDYVKGTLHLDLSGLKCALQELEDVEPGCATMQQVFDAVAPWLAAEALGYSMKRYVV